MTDAPLVTTLILDAGPIIAHTSLPRAIHYYTTPAVLAELKDENARSRLQTLYSLQTRVPRKESLDFVRQFARKTGDAEVLSATDLGLIALTYEVECELNGGDWRLRSSPGQARINGAPPVREPEMASEQHSSPILDETEEGVVNLRLSDEAGFDAPAPNEGTRKEVEETLSVKDTETPENKARLEEAPLSAATTTDTPELTAESDEVSKTDESSDDDAGWITPSNIKDHQAKESNLDNSTQQETKMMKVACATHDFALQNVLLQIGLNLISGDGKRISSVKTWIMRCHACFKTSRKMDSKFCPSCGGATLLRTSISTDSKGRTAVHLKRNMQWNNRGTIYSIPKQRAGTANMKGRDNLILRADQREVEKLEKRDKYKKEVDLLDPDYIPSIVSGRRDDNGGRLKIGHGKRNPNSNRKH